MDGGTVPKHDRSCYLDAIGRGSVAVATFYTFESVANVREAFDDFIGAFLRFGERWKESDDDRSLDLNCYRPLI